MSNYILDGHTPVIEPDLIKWAQWVENASRVVKQTELPGGVKVSTVFLSVDHAFYEPGPILFETVIFGGEHDEFCERYKIWDEAEAGHQRAIELVFSVEK